jgi:hypothetical protein
MGEERKGGLGRVDPAVAEFQKKGARNPAAMTGKQKRDAKRVRIKVDLPSQEFKERLTSAAAAEETSVSQLAGLLLTWALEQYESDEYGLRELVFESKVLSGSMRIRWNLEF